MRNVLDFRGLSLKLNVTHSNIEINSIEVEDGHREEKDHV